MIFSENYYNLIKTLPSSDINRKYNSKMVTLEDFMTLKPLNVKQRNEILEKYHEYGDKKAMLLLIEHNLKFVADIAKQYLKFGELEELISVGVIGLIKAINRHNPNSTFSFKSLAKKYILNEISNFLDEDYKKNIILGDVLGGFDNVENKPMYSHQIIFNEIDYMDKHINNSIEYKKLLNMAKETLTHTEFTIFMLRFGFDNDMPMTLFEIASYLGCSRENVRQKFNKAIRKIRKIIKFKDYDQFYDIEGSCNIYTEINKGVVLDKNMCKAELYEIIKAELPIILDESEYIVICLRYGLNGELPLSRIEISKKIRLSALDVANIERRARTKLIARFNVLMVIKNSPYWLFDKFIVKYIQ